METGKLAQSHSSYSSQRLMQKIRVNKSTGQEATAFCTFVVQRFVHLVS